MASIVKYRECLVECANIINVQYAYYVQRKQMLAVLAIHLMKKRQKKKSQKKRLWVSLLIQKRKEHGFYHALLPTLRLEDLRFQNYFRMSAMQLEALLEIVGPHLQGLYVVREPISPAERLTLTLR